VSLIFNAGWSNYDDKECVKLDDVKESPISTETLKELFKLANQYPTHFEFCYTGEMKDKIYEFRVFDESSNKVKKVIKRIILPPKQ